MLLILAAIVFVALHVSERPRVRLSKLGSRFAQEGL
jgi:hypothetical protein